MSGAHEFAPDTHPDLAARLNRLEWLLIRAHLWAAAAGVGAVFLVPLVRTRPSTVAGGDSRGFDLLDTSRELLDSSSSGVFSGPGATAVGLLVVAAVFVALLVALLVQSVRPTATVTRLTAGLAAVALGLSTAVVLVVAVLAMTVIPEMQPWAPAAIAGTAGSALAWYAARLTHQRLGRGSSGLSVSAD